MIPGWRMLERTELYTGLGVQLVDDHTGHPIETPVNVTLEIEDGATWRLLDREPVVLARAIFYYPQLERYRDARNRSAKRYRVRASSDYYWPLTRIGAAEVIVQVAPYDDETRPASTLERPVQLRMLPRPAAPFGLTPVFRGRVQTAGIDSKPIPDARVFYLQPQPGGTVRRIEVLSESDGDYALPVRRIAAPLLTIQVTASGATLPFTFNPWLAATASTQNLSL